MLVRLNTLFINQPKFLFYIYIFRCGSISLKDLLPHYKISHSLFSSVQKNDLLTKKWSAPVYVKNLDEQEDWRGLLESSVHLKLVKSK